MSKAKDMTPEVKVRDAHYFRIHRWLRSNYGDACRCEICNSTQTRNMDGQRKRDVYMNIIEIIF